jgi:hypothetical protein
MISPVFYAWIGGATSSTGLLMWANGAPIKATAAVAAVALACTVLSVLEQRRTAKRR